MDDNSSSGKPRSLPTIDSLYTGNSDDAGFVLRARNFAEQAIRSLPPGYSYHCFEHTAQVVANATLISTSLNVDRHDQQLLLASAWLHDVGFTSVYHGHEEASCRAANKLLGSEMSAADLAIINATIIATKVPQQPKDLIGQIMCDADLLYLGTDSFEEWSNRLRDEHKNVLGREYSDREWIDINIDFIRDHRYFTAVAKEYSREGIQQNLHQLESLRDRLK